MIAWWIAGLVVLGAEAGEAPVARVTGASSSLATKTKVMEWKDGRPDWRPASFTAKSAMDGSEATAWCEGAEGRGTGQWLGVELLQATDKVEIVPGFRKLALSGDGGVAAERFEHEQWERWFAQSLAVYRSNGRPSVLEVVSAEGKVLERLAVGDRYRGHYEFALPLEPGRYRLRIARVEAGTKYADTCIAEVKFSRASPGPEPVVQDGTALPEQLRVLSVPQTCRSEGKVRLLPSSFRVIGGGVNRSGKASSLHLGVAVHTADGRLLPTTRPACFAGPGMPGIECTGAGEETGPEALDDAVLDFPAWSADLRLPAPDAKEPGHWKGEYVPREGEKLELKVEAAPPRYTVTASREGSVVEVARYTCTPPR